MQTVETYRLAKGAYEHDQPLNLKQSMTVLYMMLWPLVMVWLVYTNGYSAMLLRDCTIFLIYPLEILALGLFVYRLSPKLAALGVLVYPALFICTTALQIGVMLSLRPSVIVQATYAFTFVMAWFITFGVLTILLQCLRQTPAKERAFTRNLMSFVLACWILYQIVA